MWGTAAPTDTVATDGLSPVRRVAWRRAVRVGWHFRRDRHGTNMSSDAGDPLSRNRLGDEASPYLRQHADNPVNWQPWDETALAAARERDRPIFLSVGYSACHWCHVMEEQSFEDPETAALLNEHFVPIKVDREERPDLDSVYQTVCQMITGSGGWPLSAWLTPEGDPFYVGTYFPPEARGNRPGFSDLLEGLAESWADPEDRRQMEERASEWTSAARGELEEVSVGQDDRSGEATTATDPGDSPLFDVADALLRTADRDHGGFTRTGPKFPSPWRVQALFVAHERTGREAYRDVALETLDAMHAGGTYDHLGGGFHRYATDRTWTVPHFEKMLYDNAELARAYLAAHQVTGEDRYADVARETFAFVARELTHPDGGFYATLDARSRPPGGGDPEEGAFYVWTPSSVREALDEDAALFADRFGVTETGNFEGQTVLTLTESVESLAENHDLSPDEVRERLVAAREAAVGARADRPRPARDEKVIAGWNGLMANALAEGGRVLGDDEYTARATKALAFVRDHLYDAETGRLRRRYAEDEDGPDVKGEGYLDDYAFVGRAALTLYGVTDEVTYLDLALSLAETVVAEFHDADRETLYFTPASGEGLVTRPQELRDQSTPSSLAVALDLLGALDHFRPDDRFATVVESVLDAHAARLTSRPTEHVSLALSADRSLTGHTEVTAAADPVPAAWHEGFAERYVPNLLFAPRPPTPEGLDAWLETLGLDAAGPIWADRDARDGPTLYVCRDFTCSPPQDDVESALSWVDDLRPTTVD